MQEFPDHIADRDQEEGFLAKGEQIAERPHPLTPVVKSGIAVLAGLVIIARETIERFFTPHESSGGNSSLWIVGIAFGLIAVGYLLVMIAGYISWRYTRFIIDDEQIRIEFTFISHRSDRIAFSKIQSVDVVQPLLARLLGLAALKIDVGASSNSDKKIEYLKRDRAYHLRNYLMARAKGEKITVLESADRQIGTALVDLAPSDRIITRVPLERAIGACFLSGGFIVLVVILIAIMGFAFYSGSIAAGMGFIGTSIIFIFSAIHAIFSQVKKTYNFTLSHEGQGAIRLSAGLTTLASQSVPIKRIQGISIQSPLIWRVLKWRRVKIEVLGDAMSSSDSHLSSTLIPIATDEQVRSVIKAIWPHIDLDAIAMHPIPARARYFRWLDAHTYSWGYDDCVLVSRGFLFNPRIDIVPHARVQSVRLIQGPLQRLVNVASVQAHTTHGPVNLVCRHMDAQDARSLALGELNRMRKARQEGKLPYTCEKQGSQADEDPQCSSDDEWIQAVDGRGDC